jgi:hypothetical protein
VSAACSLEHRPRRQADEPDPLTVSPGCFELRAYRLRADAAHDVLDNYLALALMPELNRRGVRAVGVFTEPDAADGRAVWVLIPHSSMESMAAVNATIAAAPAVLAAASANLRTPTKANPAFTRVDSWLMLGMTGQPRLVLPALSRARQPRIFELRTYESYSELTALKKVEMLNTGEIAAMREMQLAPVFVGQAIAGRDLPHLATLLCSVDRATHEANCRAYERSPVCAKLAADPQYADTVSRVVSRFLVPTPYSQI